MISIIIPFKEGKKYLEDCILSISEQTMRDLEVILVLDCGDGMISDIEEKCASMLSGIKFSITDNKLCPGVSGARNTGLSLAKGDYIFFLDSDDYLQPDTLEKLSAAIDGKDIAYGSVFGTWFKKSSFDKSQGNVIYDPDSADDDVAQKEKTDANFDDIYEYKITQHMSVDELSCLGMLYKKSLLNRCFGEMQNAFDMEQTYYSDAEFLVKVLIEAGECVPVRDALYIKRYHNDEVALPAISQIKDGKRDFDLTRAYRRSMSELKNNSAGIKESTKAQYSLETNEKKLPVQEEIYKHLEHMICRYIAERFSRRFHDDGGKTIDKENFDDISKLCQSVSAETIKEYGLFDRAVLSAFRSGNMDKARRSANVRLIKKKIKLMLTDSKHVKRTINLYIFRKLPEKKNWIVFESFVGRQYSGQPKYIYEYMQKNRGSSYRYIWIIDDKNIKIPGKCVRAKRFSLRYYYYMTRSRFWVNNMRQPYFLPRRDSQIMLETWHGTPLKKLALDLDDIHCSNPVYKNTIHKQVAGWNYLLSDNHFSTEIFEHCFGIDKNKILEYGYPANDPLYDRNLSERSEEIKKEIGVPIGKKTILYAPTWRDDQFYGAGKYKFSLALDIEMLKNRLGDEYVLLLRTHYWVVDRLDLTEYGDFVINVCDYSDVTRLYIASDILITDYSSVFFDYANLRRPILFYMYDLENYGDVLRGFYLDVNSELPGPVLRTSGEVVSAIENIDNITKVYSSRYEDFYNRFCSIDDGSAAKRICDRLF